MEFSEEALVLKVGRFREVDAWVRLFSPKRGVYNAFAFGGCVSRRRFCGCLDVFNRVRFKAAVCSRRKYISLKEGRLVSSYGNIRTHGDRLGQAVNCLKFFEAVHPVDSGDPLHGPDPANVAHRNAPGAPMAGRAFVLLSGALEALDAEAPSSGLFPLFFRAKAALVQGLFPDFGVCAACGQNLFDGRGAVLYIAEGRFFCPQCRGRDGGAGAFPGIAPIRPEALDLFAMINDRSPRSWLRAAPSAGAAGDFSRAVDGFVEYHLGLVWNNNRFMRT